MCFHSPRIPRVIMKLLPTAVLGLVAGCVFIPPAPPPQWPSSPPPQRPRQSAPPVRPEPSFPSSGGESFQPLPSPELPFPPPGGPPVNLLPRSEPPAPRLPEGPPSDWVNPPPVQ